MQPSLYTIEAYVLGIGWVVFDYTRDYLQAERLEAAAAIADDNRWPGTVPRRTRILIDGVPAGSKPPTTFAEIFPS